MEQIEADLWLQYSELGGIQDKDNEVSGANGGNPAYTAALTILDGDMPQYVHDNTDDEISHAAFLKAYLELKGAEAGDISRFATLPSSKATGANQNIKRLTNLTQLTVDTSFWSRYRSITNPDFDPGAPFVQTVPSLNVGQHTAIPRTDADTAGSDPSNPPTSISPLLQAIAFTAGFHFAFIEQGGTSLYPALAQKVTNLEVLRVLLSIGPERDHALSDLAGQGRQCASSDQCDRPSKQLIAYVYESRGGPGRDESGIPEWRYVAGQPDHARANPFPHQQQPNVSARRDHSSDATELGGAMASFNCFANDGLFIGQTKEFFKVMRDLAEQADAARRQL